MSILLMVGTVTLQVYRQFSTSAPFVWFLLVDSCQSWNWEQWRCFHREFVSRFFWEGRGICFLSLSEFDRCAQIFGGPNGSHSQRVNIVIIYRQNISFREFRSARS